MTVRDSDKGELIPIAEEFEKLGFDLYATGKTANVLNSEELLQMQFAKLEKVNQIYLI